MVREYQIAATARNLDMSQEVVVTRKIPFVLTPDQTWMFWNKDKKDWDHVPKDCI